MSARDELFARLCTDAPEAKWCAEDPHVEEYVGTPLQRYKELAAEQLTTVAEVHSLARVPEAVAEYLQAAGIRTPVVVAPDLVDLPWQSAGIAMERQRAAADGELRVSSAAFAVAESGALVLTSNRSSVADDFLAETHVLVLHEERILPHLPALWAALRRHALPREFCLVTGPSRTADLGVPAKMGAHGPARVHVIVVLQHSG